MRLSLNQNLIPHSLPNMPPRILPSLLRLGIALASSLMILALLIQFVSGSHDAADRPQLFNLLSSTALSGVAVYIVLHLCGLVVRALRYRILLHAANDPATPSLGHMILVTGFRNMVVDMLPSRLGELGYVALLNRAYGVSAGACFSSLAVGAVFDFIGLALVVLGVMVVSVAGGGMQGWLVGALIMAVVVSLIGVLVLTRLVPWITAVLQRLSGNTGIRRWVGKLALLSADVNKALIVTREAGVFGQILGLSIVIRVLKYLSIFMVFTAVAGPSLEAVANAAKTSVLAAIVGAEIGASLPIPTFMSFGSYEAGGTLVFSLLGVDPKEGLMALLATHIWSQAIDYSLGALCLGLVIWLTRRTRQQPEPRAQSGAWKRPLAVVAVSGLLLVAALAAAWQYRGMQKMGALTAPASGQSVLAADTGQRSSMQAALADTGADGFVVWSSNRDGNHDIFRMTLPGGEISPLTRHPHTETWPRISPDGSKLLFARSREPWVSQRNPVPWDVILLDLETSRERQIAEQASYPFWIDGDTVGYLEAGTRVVEQALSGDRRTVLLEAGGDGTLSARAQITSPSYNQDTDTLAFTARQSAIGLATGTWGTALWQPGSGQLDGVFNGCQLLWSSDRKSLYQVGKGGHQTNRIYRVDPATLSAQPLLDLPGAFSHEYWPRDDRAGRFMVFGASSGGHEHDTADYEIFLWKIGSPADQATRLTFHTGNDNWPDIFIK